MSKLKHWKDKIIEIDIDGYSHQGAGIGRIENLAIFIEGAIPGEKVKARITETKKNFLKGNLLEVLIPSLHRTEAPCPVFTSCGGCQLQHISYEKQLDLKTQMVKDMLIRLGKLTEVKVLATIGMEKPWHYRNKGHFQVETRNGKLVLGFYGASSYELVPAHHCLLFSPKVTEIIRDLEELLNQYKIEGYNRKTARGYLRNIMIRESKATGEVLLVFVTKDKRTASLTEICTSLTKKYPQIVSLWQNINTTTESMLLGNVSILIAGQEYIKDKIGQFEYQISPQSFFQINPVQTEVLYSKAKEYAGLTGQEIVLDAYCGIGTIGLFLSSSAQKIIGIEVVKEAIEDAKTNALLNQAANTEFLVGQVEIELPRLVQQGFKPDVVIVDPPRKGCDPKTLEAILQVMSTKIVYVSCDPATLARDLRVLVNGGYRVVEVQPVDMFPQTGHVECVVLIERV